MMQEIILSKKKNGMFVMLTTILLYLAAIAVTICGAIHLENGGSPILVIVGLAWIVVG